MCTTFRGTYELRAADDHWPEQFVDSPYMSGGKLCFPMRLQLSVAPVYPDMTSTDESAQPTTGRDDSNPAVLSVHPDPSMALWPGQDLMVRAQTQARTARTDHLTIITVK